jgi:hypothetical protein
VRLDPEAGTIELSVQKQPGAGLEALRQPGLVEPDGLRRARFVGHRGLDDHQAAAAGSPQA